MQNCFHLAIPVHDLKVSKDFYANKLNLTIGRESNQFVIVNFFGHQVVLHLSPDDVPEKVQMYPRHFGLVIEKEQDYVSLLFRARSNNCDFFKDDFTRWPGKDEEHRSFFLQDPSNNLLEFKWYKEHSEIF